MDAVRTGGFPPLSTPRKIGPDLGFLFLAAVIIGMHASDRHMEAGATTQRIGVTPDQGVREGGFLNSFLDRSGLRSNQYFPPDLNSILNSKI
jgi:hypothetical protein